ncbi:MAG: cobalt-precorrin-5B (C(1))-methyltransferase [Thiohalomonadales bacterium]
MRAESPEQKKKLRSGFTTGACATATSLAAATLLLENEPLDAIEICLPRGELTRFVLTYCRLGPKQHEAHCATIKDAGDDPDVTHRAEIIATVALTSAVGVKFVAGQGVGTVTRAGLSLEVGEPAINPVPREMMTMHLGKLAERNAYTGGFRITISITHGVALAKKTMNARLGIIGGLSILGTTGIVKPFSCAAYIASIHQAMDVAKANGLEHIAACTGSTSDRIIQSIYTLDEMARIEMGDYVGAVLKHARKVSFRKMTFIGGFGKISKLAEGQLNLHSQKSSINFPRFAQLAAQYRRDGDLQNRLLGANTSAEVLNICAEFDIPIADDICTLALQQLQSRLDPAIEVECITIDKSGSVIARVFGK